MQIAETERESPHARRTEAATLSVFLAKAITGQVRG
jgi:hypothetical protein